MSKFALIRNVKIIFSKLFYFLFICWLIFYQLINHSRDIISDKLNMGFKDFFHDRYKNYYQNQSFFKVSALIWDFKKLNGFTRIFLPKFNWFYKVILRFFNRSLLNLLCFFTASSAINLLSRLYIPIKVSLNSLWRFIYPSLHIV